MEIKEKLLKLYELSKRGVKGEKDNAEFLLNKLLKKHSISIEELQENEERVRYYKYTTLESHDIILQVIASITNRDSIYGVKGHKVLEAKTTNYEHIQILEKIDYHLDNFKKEKKKFLSDFLNAYIQKHKLFMTDSSGDPQETHTKEELEAIERMFKLKSMLSDSDYIKKLNE